MSGGARDWCSLDVAVCSADALKLACSLLSLVHLTAEHLEPSTQGRRAGGAASAGPPRRRSLSSSTNVQITA